MVSLRSGIREVLSRYPSAAAGTFAGHDVGKLLRFGLPEAVRGVVGGENYQVVGSAGQSQWAETPWVALSPLPSVQRRLSRLLTVLHLPASGRVSRFSVCSADLRGHRTTAAQSVARFGSPLLILYHVERVNANHFGHFLIAHGTDDGRLQER
jgi:MrcB-like, N-terminal domain